MAKNVTLKRVNNADGTTDDLHPSTSWGQIDATTIPDDFNPSSHTHGNITNGGEITASATIATGDHLVIADNSSGNDLTTSSITFDTSNTTQFLRKDGTFATPAGVDNYVNISGDTMTGNLTTTSGNNGGIYIGSGGSNITSVSPSNKDIVIQDVAQIRFGSASWDWNSWAGLAFNASTEVLTIGGPASSVFSSNSNPPLIDVNFDGLNTSGLKVNNNTVWHDGIFEPIVDNLDVLPTYTSSNEDFIKYNTTERAIEVQGSDDSFGAVYPAIKTESGVSYKISFSIKSNTTTTSGGVYFRPQEYDSALPDGKTHIAGNATHSEVQEATRQLTSFYENQNIGTSWEQHSFFYTPTSTAVWFSLMFLNWTGLGTNSLFIKNLRVDAIQEDSADANTLDGLDSTQFLRSDQGGTMSGNLTISNTLPTITFTDTNHNSDFNIANNNGVFTVGDTTNQLDRFAILSNGNVGIGTTSPAYKLDVEGDFRVKATYDFVIRQLEISSSSYDRRVITLVPKHTSNAGATRAVYGEFTLGKKGGNIFDPFKLGVQSVYNNTRGFIQENGTNKVGHKFVEFDYNSVRWIGVELAYEANPYNYCMFYGTAETDTASGDQLKVLSYYDENGGGVLNSEIYNSLADFTVSNSTDTIYYNGHEVWHDGNDGIGSGLHADLLDGQHGSYYAPLASPALTGTPTAPTAAANTNTTQIATTAYVQQEITDLIGGAPGALDTLNELAAAINDDASYASTITTALAGKVAKSGDTMTGALTISHPSSTSILNLNAVAGQSTQMLFKEAGTVKSALTYVAGSDKLIFNNEGDRLTIDNSGNVGIGTTSPGAPLTVSKASTQNTGATSIINTHSSGGRMYPGLKVTNTYSNHSYGIVAEFRTQNASGSDRPSILFSSNHSSNTWTVGQGGYSANDNFAITHRTFHPNDTSGWGTARLMIDTSGNVGIGTTSPVEKLEVSGKIKANNEVIATKFVDWNNGAYYLDPAGTSNLNAVDANLFEASSASSRDKFRVYPSSAYTIGMQSGVSYGGLNDWAMTFQFNNDNDRGFWWGDQAHTTAQGAMALTTNGLLTVASKIRVGYGELDTTIPATYALDVNGNLRLNGSLPKIQFTDTDNDSDFHIANNNGVLEIADTTNQLERFKIDSSGNVTLPASGGLTLVDKALTNSSGAVLWDGDEIYHEGHKPTYAELGTMAYSNLTGTPTIPTNNNQLTNGAGYTTNTGTVTSVATGGGLTGGTITGSGTISHADTSSQASVNNSGNTFIQDITLDTYGHITGITSATATSSGGNTWTEIKTGSTTITGGTTATNVSLGSNSVDDTTVLAIELNAGSVLSYTSQIYIVKLEDSSNTNAGILFNAGANSSSIYTGSLRIYRTLSMGPTSTSITFSYSYNHSNGSSAETADTVYVGKIWKLGVTGS